MTITIYHNPICGTSRNTLAMIRNSGDEPVIVEYLKTPLSKEELRALVKRLGIAVQGLVRAKEPAYAELGLANASDEALLDAMAAHPILMNRPVVITPLGAKLCRPESEVVLDILPNPQRGAFSKEDGTPVIEANSRRIL